MNTTRATALILAVAALAFTAGCSGKHAAERDGKQLGEAICDVRDADSAEAASEAIAEVERQLDDLGDKLALYTAEDRADVQNNLADLLEHRVQGQDLLMNQDLTVLERSISNIRDDANETSRAAWDGILQGLSSCTQQ